MKIKTSELGGVALDWAVAKAEGASRTRLDAEDFPYLQREGKCRYSTDWSQGGPIIQKHLIQLTTIHDGQSEWGAYLDDGNPPYSSLYSDDCPLTAAMRCYVASKLGDEVDIPEELIHA